MFRSSGCNWYLVIALLVLLAILFSEMSKQADYSDPLLFDEDFRPLATHSFMPNDFYTESASTPTKLKLAVPNTMLEWNFWSKKGLDLGVNDMDGWATSSFIYLYGLQDIHMDYAYLGIKHASELNNGSVIADEDGKTGSLNGFASHMTVQRSLEDDSPTLLIDAETGERVAHFVEEDRSGDANLFKTSYPMTTKPKQQPRLPRMFSSSRRQILIIRPAQALESGRRYIVALRNLIGKVDGGHTPLEAPYGFRVVRDDLETASRELAARKQQFKERRIFETLQGHVKPTDNLILAWDFTTASHESATEPLRFMRDDAEEKIKMNGYKYQVTSVVDDYSEFIYRRVEGTFSVPLYIDSADPRISNHLKRNKSAVDYLESRRPLSGGQWAEIPFIMFIPRSLVIETSEGYKGLKSGTLLQFGHGLFDSRMEMNQLYLHKLANEQKFVLFGCDWMGLARPDIPPLSGIILFDLSQISTISDRCQQGVLNQVMLMNVVRYGDMRYDPKVLVVGGSSVVELDEDRVRHVNFLGISLGGILGTIYSAISKEVAASTLGVPGGPFSLLFQRNTATYFVFTYFLQLHLSKSEDRLKALFLCQQTWQSSDPATYAPILAKGKYLGQGAEIEMTKHVLVQWAPTDALVSSVGNLYLMRSLNCYSYENDAFEMYYRYLDGFHVYSTLERDTNHKKDAKTFLNVIKNEEEVLHVCSAFHFDKVAWSSPFHNLPFPFHDAMKNNAHDYPRLNKKAHQQMDEFFNNCRNRKKGVLAPQPCKNGCWHEPIPPRNELMSYAKRK